MQILGGYRFRERVFWLAIGAVHCLPMVASASEMDKEIDRARGHFRSGQAYYEEGRYHEAAKEFSEAYRLTWHPDVLYNLAATYDRLGDAQKALESYVEYIQLRPEAPDRFRVNRRIRELRVVLSAQRALDAQAASSRPTDLRPRDSSLADGNGSTDPRRTGALIAWALSGGAALAAGVTGILALSQNDSDACSDCAGEPGNRGPDAADRFASVSTVLSGVALVGAVAGVALTLWASGEEAGEPGARLELAPGPGVLGAQGRLRF